MDVVERGNLNEPKVDDRPENVAGAFAAPRAWDSDKHVERLLGSLSRASTAGAMLSSLDCAAVAGKVTGICCIDLYVAKGAGEGVCGNLAMEMCDCNCLASTRGDCGKRGLDAEYNILGECFAKEPFLEAATGAIDAATGAGDVALAMVAGVAVGEGEMVRDRHGLAPGAAIIDAISTAGAVTNPGTAAVAISVPVCNIASNVSPSGTAMGLGCASCSCATAVPSLPALSKHELTILSSATSCKLDLCCVVVSSMSSPRRRRLSSSLRISSELFSMAERSNVAD